MFNFNPQIYSRENVTVTNKPNNDVLTFNHENGSTTTVSYKNGIYMTGKTAPDGNLGAYTNVASKDEAHKIVFDELMQDDTCVLNFKDGKTRTIERDQSGNYFLSGTPAPGYLGAFTRAEISEEDARHMVIEHLTDNGIFVNTGRIEDGCMPVNKGMNIIEKLVAFLSGKHK